MVAVGEAEASNAGEQLARKAERLFLRLALLGAGRTRPRVINVDGHPAYVRAIAELKQSGDLAGDAAAGRHCI
jgi:hypothetical protein